MVVREFGSVELFISLQGFIAMGGSEGKFLNLASVKNENG